MKRRNYFITCLVIFSLALGACSSLYSGGGIDQNAVATQSALLIAQGQATGTSEALETELAAAETALVVAEQPTLAMTPTVTLSLPTQTLFPTQTPPPSVTPLPSFTRVPPTATLPPIPCDIAEFVTDVNFPDGTVVAPGQSFTKIWRLKNVGTCTWTTGYSLVFSSGEQMGGSSPQVLSANVAPGETIDVSVNLTAPTSEGTYRSSWKLRNVSGVDFGIGAKGSSFYAKIEVKTSQSGYAFDFVNTFCSADWSSGAGSLSCSGSDGDAKGFVLRADKAVLETGTQDDEPALIMQPQAITDGIIRGKYPTYKVVDGDSFKAIVMCAYQSTNCDVKLQLDYQVGSDSIQTLASWNEKYDDQYTSVSVDLSSLAGKEVHFILTVMANGAMNQDRAQWLAPRIVHK